MLTRSEYVQQKTVTVEKAVQLREIWGLKKDKVVFTNGCFDVLHRGHVEYLSKAAEYGNRLVVGVNSDHSVRGLNKAENRPINDEQSRAFLIAALGFVDAVVIFDSETPLDLIRVLHPEVLVKGGDYDEHETNPSKKTYIVGSDLVLGAGGTIKTIGLTEGFSTTNLINQIRNGIS